MSKHTHKLGGRTSWPRIIELRRQKKTYQEIADMFSVTRERIRQIIKLIEPELIGCYTSTVQQCGACKKANTAGDFSKLFSGYSRKQALSLCRKCCPRFMAYRRHRKALRVYAERYRFVKDQLSSGAKAYHLGWLWKNETPPALRMGDPCRYEMTWSHRVRRVYETALRHAKVLERSHPWLITCYAEIEGG